MVLQPTYLLPFISLLSLLLLSLQCSLCAAHVATQNRPEPDTDIDRWCLSSQARIFGTHRALISDLEFCTVMNGRVTDLFTFGFNVTDSQTGQVMSYSRFMDSYLRTVYSSMKHDMYEIMSSTSLTPTCMDKCLEQVKSMLCAGGE